MSACPVCRATTVLRVTRREHKPLELGSGCCCGLQAGHPGDCEPRIEVKS